MLVLTVLATFLSTAGDDRLSIRINEPSSGIATLSIDARLLLVAEVVADDPIREAWLEFRIEKGADWERRSLASSRWVQLSSNRTVLPAILEPRSLPGVRAGDTIRVRIAAAGVAGAQGSSRSLEITVREAEERESLLESRLEQGRRELQELRKQVERDHRTLSRIERRSREAAATDDLRSIASGWTLLLDRFPRLSRELLDALEEGETDQLVDPRRADRCRRSIVETLRRYGDADSPLSAMKRDLVRTVRAQTLEERRAALLSTLENSDRFLDLLLIPDGALEAWHESLVLRRTLRSILKGQKELTEELDRHRKR